MLHALLMTVHILVCLALIGIVLLQQGKGADMGAAFGGSSQTLFGSTGATTLLGKLTAAAAGIFMLTSLTLTYQAANRYKSTVTRETPAAAAPAEAVPAAPAAETQAAPAGESQAAPAAEPQAAPAKEASAPAAEQKSE